MMTIWVILGIVCVTSLPLTEGSCAVPTIDNGAVTVDSGGTFVTHDQTVTIRCNANYALDGPSSRKCYNGTIEPLPRCVAINRCERIEGDSRQSVSSYGEMCFIYYNFKKTWNGADRVCREKGGNLVEILNEGVMQHIKGKLNSLQWRSSGVWIGARRSNHIWRWTTGRRVTYDNFAPGQRDCSFCIKNCANMRSIDDWKWHDYFCRMIGYKYKFICQFYQ